MFWVVKLVWGPSYGWADGIGFVPARPSQVVVPDCPLPPLTASGGSQ